MDRPLLTYYGSKWNCADWIISHLPKHSTYVDVFGGSAAVLLNKPKQGTEVYNDINQDLVNLFRVVRDESKAKQLADKIYMTPWSRVEFEEAYTETDDEIERARRLLTRSFLGWGSRGATVNTGFRWIADLNCERVALNRFCNYIPQDILDACNRFKQVQIESLDYKILVERYDSKETLFYFDPPYMHETRVSKKVYEGEMTYQEHEQFLEIACNIKGMALISGYSSELYLEKLNGWEMHKRKALSVNAGKGSFIECLWCHPNNGETTQGRLEL